MDKSAMMSVEIGKGTFADNPSSSVILGKRIVKSFDLRRIEQRHVAIQVTLGLQRHGLTGTACGQEGTGIHERDDVKFEF